MVHNGIEYGMLQAYAEGFDLLHAATEYDYDLHQIAELWNHGSVVRSWLLELAARRASKRTRGSSELEATWTTRAKGAGPCIEAIERGVTVAGDRAGAVRALHSPRGRTRSRCA